MTSKQIQKVKSGLGRPPDPELRKQRGCEILIAATQLFAQRGYEATDIQSIADHLHVSKGLIYRYFDSKEQLFLACLDGGVEQLTKAIQTASHCDGTELDKVSGAILAYLEFFHQHSEIVELFIQERVFFRDRERSTYFANRDANLEPWRAMLAEMIERKIIRDIPVDQILDHICDLTYGIIFTDRILGRSRSPKEKHAEVMKLLLHGLLP